MSGGDANVAEDVTHDAFVRLLEKAHTLDRGTSAAGWLVTVARGYCLDRMRRQQTWWQRVRRTLVAGAQPEISSPPARTEDAELSAHLRAALRELPPKQRAVVAMKYLENMQQTEVAAALGLSEGYVSKLLARGLERLRAMGWQVDDV